MGERTRVRVRIDIGIVRLEQEAERSRRSSVHRPHRSVSRISITKRKRWWSRFRSGSRAGAGIGQAGEGGDAGGRRLAVVGGGAGAARRTSDAGPAGARAVPCHPARRPLCAAPAAAGHIA